MSFPPPNFVGLRILVWFGILDRYSGSVARIGFDQPMAIVGSINSAGQLKSWVGEFLA
jgi:hypothetical protein